MTVHRLFWAALLIGSVGAARADNVVSSTAVIDPARLTEPNYLSSWQASFQHVTGSNPTALKVTYNAIWGGIWQHRDTPFNWSNVDCFKFTLQNLSPQATVLTLKVEGTPTNSDPNKTDSVTFDVPANKTITYVVDLNPDTPKQHGMHIMTPAIDTSHIRLFMTKKVSLPQIYRWSLYQRENLQVQVVLSDVRLLTTNRSATGIIDTFGQYTKQSWAGKVGGITGLSTSLSNEQIDLANNPGPDGLRGPTNLPVLLPASTKWRTFKSSTGKWFLVHPSGRRFWSFGVTGVSWTNATSVTGREYVFQNLPPRDATYTQFYGTVNNKSTFDFTGANLYRKFGDDYKVDFVQHASNRLKSWGMNTVAAWSTAMEGQAQVPYTLVRHLHGFPKRIQTPMYFGNTFPDPFDPTFQAWTTTYLTQQLAPHNGKENFMGVFVDNELPWGMTYSPQVRYQLATTVLNGPLTTAAKVEFLRQLQNKYGKVIRLNATWGTNYTSWAALEGLNGFNAANMTAGCQLDMSEFVTSFANAYFSKVRAALTTAGLTGLYLGSREVWATPESMAAAQNYVDVYSLNLYSDAIHIDWSFPGINKPIMIGEFTFSAIDRGGFGGYLATQADRAASLRAYMLAAITSQKVVGAHWFQYYDQPASGRASDAENWAVGMVSIADQPHSEMVQVAREVGQSMYNWRGN